MRSSKVLDLRLPAPLQLSKETGARIEEIWNLEWTDIDLERGFENAQICMERSWSGRESEVSCVFISEPRICPEADSEEKVPRLLKVYRNRIHDHAPP